MWGLLPKGCALGPGLCQWHSRWKSSRTIRLSGTVNSKRYADCPGYVRFPSYPGGQDWWMRLWKALWKNLEGLSRLPVLMALFFALLPLTGHTLRNRTKPLIFASACQAWV